MTPEDRAALWKRMEQDPGGIGVNEAVALLSALEEAERERNEVWRALCGIDLGRRPIDWVSEVLRDPAARTHFLQQWVEDSQAERSESAALRAEVARLESQRDEAWRERDEANRCNRVACLAEEHARAEVERMRAGIEALRKKYSDLWDEDAGDYYAGQYSRADEIEDDLAALSGGEGAK